MFNDVREGDGQGFASPLQGQSINRDIFGDSPRTDTLTALVERFDATLPALKVKPYDFTPGDSQLTIALSPFVGEWRLDRRASVGVGTYTYPGGNEQCPEQLTVTTEWSRGDLMEANNGRLPCANAMISWLWLDGINGAPDVVTSEDSKTVEFSNQRHAASSKQGLFSDFTFWYYSIKFENNRMQVHRGTIDPKPLDSLTDCTYRRERNRNH